MLKFCSLYSGSSGNSLFIQSNNTKILIDCGVSAKKIVDALTLINVDVNDIDAILVSHEHSDHIQSLGTFSNKFNVPVYANSNTWDNMEIQRSKILENNIRLFVTDEDFNIGDIKIHSFSIPHDASDPCGFSFILDDEKFTVATDLGHINTHILNNLQGSNFLMLEANYDPEVLKCSSYPYVLKTRIAGANRTFGK